MIPRPTSSRRCWPPDSRLTRSSLFSDESDQLDHLVDGPRIGVVARVARQHLAHRVVGLDRQLLEYHADASTKPALRAVVCRVDAQCLHPPAAPIAESLQDLDRSGLPSAVRPEQREHLTFLDLEADVAHGQGVPVGLGEVLHAHGRHGDPIFPRVGAAKPPSE